MASDVDICNVALAMLGDAALVQSISPPDQTAQAAHCSRFYPIARDALLEMHTWGFATTRATLAQLSTNPSSTWQYCYAVPTGAVNLLEILDPNAIDDYSTGIQMANVIPNQPQIGVGSYMPRPFVSETFAGESVILTNQAGAVLRFTELITDTTQFSPLFSMGLSMLLSSLLAGPLLKGAEGRQVAKEQMEIFLKWKESAVESDSNQRSVKPAPGASWIVNR